MTPARATSAARRAGSGPSRLTAPSAPLSGDARGHEGGCPQVGPARAAQPLVGVVAVGLVPGLAAEDPADEGRPRVGDVEGEGGENGLGRQTGPQAEDGQRRPARRRGSSCPRRRGTCGPGAG